MTTQRRFAQHGDDETLRRMHARGGPPATLPMQAYGPEIIVWAEGALLPVWVWVQPRDRPAERVAGFVKGHNDRVCVVQVPGEGGGWEVTVWRNAVAHRQA